MRSPRSEPEQSICAAKATASARAVGAFNSADACRRMDLFVIIIIIIIVLFRMIRFNMIMYIMSYY